MYHPKKESLKVVQMRSMRGHRRRRGQRRLPLQCFCRPTILMLLLLILRPAPRVEHQRCGRGEHISVGALLRQQVGVLAGAVVVVGAGAGRVARNGALKVVRRDRRSNGRRSGSGLARNEGKVCVGSIPRGGGGQRREDRLTLRALRMIITSTVSGIVKMSPATADGRQPFRRRRPLSLLVLGKERRRVGVEAVADSAVFSSPNIADHQRRQLQGVGGLAAQ